MARPAVNVAALSREEQLQLLDELWELLGCDPGALPLTNDQRRDLDERLDALEREGPVGLSWNETRIVRLAKKAGRSPHAFMLEALERQTRREEQVEAFVEEALAADRGIEDGDEVYAAEDVHAWLPRLARGDRAARLKPVRR